MSYGRERYAAHSRYWWENPGRQPIRLCVFQRTIAGAMVLRGRDGQTRTVPVGHAVLFCYGEDSAYGLPSDSPDGYVGAWLDLDGAGLPEHWNWLRAEHGEIIAVPPGGTVANASETLIDLAEPRRATAPLDLAAAVQQFVLTLAGSLQQHSLSTQAPIEQAIYALLAQPLAPWSLKELAEQYGISREHFSRAFRARTGAAPAAWLNRQRVAKARELLAGTMLGMTAIAAQSGFASVHTCARQVRLATGRAPTTSRRCAE